jgi:zinc transport system substrate-binding protein
MKKIQRGHIFFFLAFSLICRTVSATAVPSKPLCVAATIFPLADMVRHVGGDAVQVLQILPAGASPHTFDLTPGKVRELQSARIIFKIGAIDDWIDGIAESVPGVKIVHLRKGIVLMPTHDDDHHHGGTQDHGDDEFDPHYWLSAANGMVMARNIAGTLAAADPTHAAVYMENYRAFARELTGLHEEIKKEISALKNKKMIVFHDAWRYFAAAYGLEIAAVFQSSPGREPTPRDLQKLYSRVKSLGIRAIFSEPQLPASSIEPLLQDLALEVVVLDPLGGTSAGDSYAGLLRRNAQAICRALER